MKRRSKQPRKGGGALLQPIHSGPKIANSSGIEAQQSTAVEVREMQEIAVGVFWEDRRLHCDAQRVFPSAKAISHAEPANMNLLIDHRATTCNANPIQILQGPAERLPTLTRGMIGGFEGSGAWKD